MAFQPGAGNSLGQIRAKPFREALRIEAALAEQGQGTPALKGTLRYIARQMLDRAGDDNQTAIAVADRLDGKPAQAIVGDDEAAPVRLEQIRRIIVKPGHTDGGSIPAAVDPE